MEEIRADRKLNAQQQVYAKCVEYKQALMDALERAKQQLTVQEHINSHTDFAKAEKECEQKIVNDVKNVSQERQNMCNELKYVITKIEHQLSKLDAVQTWMVENYENIVQMDIALNGVIGLDVTIEEYNSLRNY